LDDRLADAEGTFDDEQGLVLFGPDLHGVVLALGRYLELGGLVLGCIAVVGQGDAADDEENGKGKAAGSHAAPLAWEFCLVRPTPGEPVGSPAWAIVFGTPAGQRSPLSGCRPTSKVAGVARPGRISRSPPPDAGAGQPG